MAESAGIVVIGGGISLLDSMKTLCRKKGQKVTYIFGNPFCEWHLMAPYFLVNTEEHPKWTSPDMSDFVKAAGPDAKIICDVVTEVVPTEKKVKTSVSGELTYDALIIATGQKMPLITLTPGVTLKQRQEEVKACGEALKTAKTVVVNGNGLVALEVAGNIKTRYPDTKVIMLSRDGKVLSTTHPEKWQDKVKRQLDKMQIEVRKASVSPVEEDFKIPQLVPGKIPLVTRMEGAELDYDVYIPAYGQGPNTQFLQAVEEMLNEQGQIIANDTLQSKKFPEVFGVGVTDQPLGGHPVSMALQQQAVTAVTNVEAFLRGDALHKHTPAALHKIPMHITLANGPKGYSFGVAEGLDPCNKLCCCIPCRGGFPCCPPPCCWCCIPGCPFAQGVCCGSPEGPGPAKFLTEISHMFTKAHFMQGQGKAPPQQEMQLGPVPAK